MMSCMYSCGGAGVGLCWGGGGGEGLFIAVNCGKFAPWILLPVSQRQAHTQTMIEWLTFFSEKQNTEG